MKLSVDTARLSEFLRRRARMIFCSVACVLAVVGLVLGMVYHAFKKIDLDLLVREYQEFAAQTDSLSNMMENMVRNYGMEIFYSPSVTSLRESGSLSSLEQVFYLRELNAYVSSSDFVDSIQIYNRAGDYVYSSDSNVLSAPLAQFEDQSAVRLFQALEPDMRIRPIQRTAFEENPEKAESYFSFLFFETTLDDEPSGGALMLNVDADWYLGTLLDFDSQDRCVLLDESGAVLAGHSEETKRWAQAFLDGVLSAEQQQAGYLIQKLDGEQVICIHSRMSSHGWYYLKILPLRECIPGLLRLRDQLMAWLLFGFILLAVCAAAALLRLYLPLHQVRDVLRRTRPLPADIAGQVSQLARESQEHQNAQLLMSLLEGRPVEQERIPPAPLTLLLVEAPDREAVRKRVLAVCPMALAGYQQGCDVILLSEMETKASAALCAELVRTNGARCYCGMPRPASGELAECYARIQEIRHQKFWYPERRIFMEADFAPRSSRSSFSEKQGASLISALRAGELDQARARWQEILDTVRQDNYRGQLFAFRRMAVLIEEEWPQSKPLLSDEFLAQLEDIQVLSDRFDGAFCQIAQQSIEQRKERLQNLASQVVRLIDAGYADANLSPPRIADEMGMSSAYLGRLFRESMQMSISQYINQTRIQKAADLLCTTSAPVEVIASMVGFTNVKYFFVVFKNIIGQTPLQYRKRFACREE